MGIILSLKNVSKTYELADGNWFKKKRTVKALNNISLNVFEHETLGIVGESGCGKSTFAKILVGLLEPTSGSVTFSGNGVDEDKTLGQGIQYVFQDPISSLNPRRTIKASVEAPLKALHNLNEQERGNRIRQAFEDVSLREEFLERYPHEFSGGQAQRIGLARSLVAKPKILILDEPVSALDVSVQAQVLNLLSDIKEKNGLTYLFISHDLAVVEAVSDRVAVFYFGALVEVGPAKDIFMSPKHPYTKLLADSAPIVGKPLYQSDRDQELPDPLNPPSGCAFASRCSRASVQCHKSTPALSQQGEAHFAACYFPL